MVISVEPFMGPMRGNTLSGSITSLVCSNVPCSYFSGSSRFTE